ncbi:hypothetical protein RHMOL_Rhmol06G0028400 [Rhododendron molle]|uniref:Uncharacterized protein n=1 Tax=Rhododendron molle TaxID=49168 RepID=A0ACC0NAD8_RHOML|nr:hypothetical protein RHMOL_Rhmol06G0028400 [Rhododendron molle]
MNLILSYPSPSPLFLSLILLVITRGISGATVTFINTCDYPVWPGILGNTQLGSTGFELPPSRSAALQAPPGWSGRFWGRTGCNFDANSGVGTCATGDCGSNQVECNGAGATPPATLAEFTLGSGSLQDFYDVSLVDGYNLPIIVEAVGGSGVCGATGCIADLNQQCPTELQVDGGQACRSACEAFGSPEYCCSGAYSTPDTCQPSVYSQIFKSACPRSYSYAYDDATSTFTCTGADYTITFCPSLTSQKSSSHSSTPTPPTTGTPTSASPITSTGTTNGSGSTDNQTVDSWLPNFLAGDSSKAISRFSTHSTLITTLVTLLIFSFHCL